MSVIDFPINKCCKCGARATKKVEYEYFDVVGPIDTKHYCDVHFPAPMTENQLRLLLDQRDSEIEELRVALAATTRNLRTLETAFRDKDPKFADIVSMNAAGNERVLDKIIRK